MNNTMKLELILWGEIQVIGLQLPQKVSKKELSMIFDRLLDKVKVSG